MGDDDHIMVKLREVLVALADQLAQQPLLNVVDILDPLGEEPVGHLLESCWRAAASPR